MRILKYFSFLILIFLTLSCAKEKLEKSIIQEKDLNLQVLEAYSEGMKALESGDVLFAAKKFNEAETLFPQSTWAPRSALMAAYSYYSQDYYGDAIAELERFIKIYPNHQNLDYVYYLIGISFYEQIVDEKKDLKSIIDSKKHFEVLIERFPNTEYSLDAEFKLDLINDTLAAKEMYLGRYYFQKKKWIAAINRFRNVIDLYDTTIYVEEALHRLVETYYVLGLVDESQKYANLLGYNYQSSEWYEQSYSLFNKNYIKKKNRKIEKNKKLTKSILSKMKSLIDSDG